MSWRELLEPPFSVAVLGDVGSGKTGTAGSIVDSFNDEYKPAILAPKSVTKYYPEDFTKVHPGNRLPKDSSIIVDDVHIMKHARDFMSSDRFLDNFNRERRHLNSNLVMTSQEGRSFDINLLGGPLSALIFKRPGMLQAEFERPQLLKFWNEARAALGENPEPSQSYIVPRNHKEVVSNTLPAWWTDDISRGYQDYFEGERVAAERKELGGKIFNVSVSILKGLGRFARV